VVLETSLRLVSKTQRAEGVVLTNLENAGV